MPDWLDVGLRSLLFIAILFLMTKLLGSKQISQLSFFEYISGITIGSVAAEVITGVDGNILHGIVVLIVFGGITYAVDVISLKSKKFRDIAEGKSSIFIKDGKVMEDSLKKEHYTIDDLNSLLRKKNVFKVADVEFAVLEPNGDLNVLLKKENQPITPKDLHLKVANEKVPQTVIMDGKILDRSLTDAQKNREWLDVELKKLGVMLDNVFLAQVDSYGQLTVDVYDDKINVPSPQQKPLLMTMIKKSQADLESFATQTEAEDAKQMYLKNSKKLKEVINLLTPYLNG
ncbi:DUF421 domain-containing protein [Neobacillus cucumis]|jgi:uncharacterized membrane protein YcaP (DUF421 family)|uniref:DUF421 domain-containing protein n=1 Tax=Neobacillus cucumis TaxID=1740721 RepID=UPI0019635427|nr:DUF421 domain-containing protein [Neobacillus cucumis]MBM7653386.1 uncharacterized membrane protein YcaP (DUF421 family) [Neobacillus cucumis]MED4224612.1 DUF421 domain-containing protein [Neobacillus cucumis]